jgi:hypothetical protein
MQRVYSFGMRCGLEVRCVFSRDSRSLTLKKIVGSKPWLISIDQLKRVLTIRHFRQLVADMWKNFAID